MSSPQSWSEPGRETRGGRGKSPGSRSAGCEGAERGGCSHPAPSTHRSLPPPSCFAVCELRRLEPPSWGSLPLCPHAGCCFPLVLVVVGKEQGYGTATTVGGWWGPKDTVPLGGAGGAGGLCLDDGEGGLPCPGRAWEGVTPYAADRGNLCFCNVPPAQHEGKALLHPWTGNQMDSDHSVPQDEQRDGWHCPLGSLAPHQPLARAHHPCPIPAPSLPTRCRRARRLSGARMGGLLLCVHGHQHLHPLPARCLSRHIRTKVPGRSEDIT